MSNSSRSDDAGALEAVGLLGASVGRPISGFAFWAAIALPFLHVPLLITGLETARMTAAFMLLLGLNVVALVLGHPYGRE
ncbi:MAG: hypothetical protein ABEH64_06210 [Salinirussus sp.]